MFEISQQMSNNIIREKVDSKSEPKFVRTVDNVRDHANQILLPRFKLSEALEPNNYLYFIKLKNTKIFTNNV